MNVRLDACGEIVIDDKFNALEIQSTTEHFRTNQQPDIAALEGRDDVFTFAAISIGVNHVESQAIVDEFFVEILCAFDGLDKEEGGGFESACLDHAAQLHKFAFFVTAEFHFLEYV